MRIFAKPAWQRRQHFNVTGYRRVGADMAVGGRVPERHRQNTPSPMPTKASQGPPSFHLVRAPCQERT